MRTLVANVILLAALTGCASLGMSTMELDDRISQITNSQEAWDLAKEIEAAENVELLYAHVLGRANQGDGHVDLACAIIKQNFAQRDSHPSRFIQTVCSHTARDPELVDVFWRYTDWEGREYNALTHDEVKVEEIEGGDLVRLFETMCTNQWGSGSCVERIFYYVALTGHYELLEGRINEAEVIQAFIDNRELLRAEIPFLRFNPETRKYELDEEAQRTQTRVDVRYQEIVGSPTGPAEGWEGDVYVGDTSSN